jgi:hypothetical protein
MADTDRTGGGGRAPLPPGFEGKLDARRSARTTLLVVIILILAAIILYLMSVLNAQTYYLEIEGNQLRVRQGLMLPFGSRIYEPDDKDLARMYAPVQLPDQIPRDLQAFGRRKYQNFAEMSLAFFDILVTLARDAIERGGQAQLALAEGYLDRAAVLPTVGGERLTHMRHVRGDLNYAYGKELMEGITERLARAAQRFQAARDLGTDRYKDVDSWLRRVQDALAEFTRGTTEGEAPSPGAGGAPDGGQPTASPTPRP